MGRPYPEVTVAVLPNSLTRVLPFTLGYSPCPPVSVLSTDTVLIILDAFPGTLLILVLSSKLEIPDIIWLKLADLPIQQPQYAYRNPITDKDY